MTRREVLMCRFVMFGRQNVYFVKKRFLLFSLYPLTAGACPYGQGNHQPGQNKTDHNSGNELWPVLLVYIEKRILNLVPMIIYRV